MENCKRMEAIEEQLQLPEPIIHHIQSSLSGKEAASTAVVSKSWYNSWLTRPILDFDERDFRNLNPYPRNNDRFFNYMNRSMERYHELNLKIESFKLWMYVRDIKSSSLATELIVKAVKMGVNKLNIEIHPPRATFILPKEVFGAESLKILSVVGCKIDGIFGENVMCSRLESLSLSDVSVGEDTMRDIISGCPLIVNLFLSNCDGDLVKVNMSKMVKLEKLCVIRQLIKQVVDWPGSFVEDERHDVVSVIDCLSNVREFHNLSYLVLDTVQIDSMLFHDFSNKFPCIEDLTVRKCYGCWRFNISSHSLKYITLAHNEKLEAEFDVPNVLKFKFCGAITSSFSFTTASRGWESDLTFACWGEFDVSWFEGLNNFLTHLSGSKISLNVVMPEEDQWDRCLLDFQDLPRPIVENLTLELYYSLSVCSAFLDGIFRSIRPKFITQRLFPIPHNKSQKANNKNPQFERRKAEFDLVQLLCKQLMDIEHGNCSSTTGNMICWNELEGGHAESFEYTLMEWRPLPWKTLLDYLISPEKEARIRFRLRWGPPDSAGPYHGERTGLDGDMAPGGIRVYTRRRKRAEVAAKN
ncbi:hypothetical protein BUALT_Bualt11G0060600 [Buddleja alternifolia]|uniref:F-box domain-containing protein n=1 Tax=Buddleja alternifolia TaxID=168488 RepID=A0AAV6WUM6_9LAMI|nr:hypothetical protein BUALT_Bualt11G0060600 [Buddleja alternifolia]